MEHGVLIFLIMGIVLSVGQSYQASEARGVSYALAAAGPDPTLSGGRAHGGDLRSGVGAGRGGPHKAVK
jgi:hypothetical protein